MKLGYLAFALVVTLQLSAQDWQKGNLSDPMNDKAYTAFGLEGKGVNENITGTLGMFCANGKFQFARLGINGMTFHYDDFAALRNPPYVTNMRVRTGNKTETKGFLVTQDMKSAQFSKQEMEKILNAGGAVFQFADGLGTFHYIQFAGASPGADLKAVCGFK